MLPRRERLAAFVEALQAAPPPESLDGAAALIERTLAHVEAPFAAEFTEEDRPLRLPPVNVVAYGARGHEAFVAHNGAILIRDTRSGAVIVDKPGLSGSRVRELAPWLATLAPPPSDEARR